MKRYDLYGQSHQKKAALMAIKIISNYFSEEYFTVKDYLNFWQMDIHTEISEIDIDTILKINNDLNEIGWKIYRIESRFCEKITICLNGNFKLMPNSIYEE